MTGAPAGPAAAGVPDYPMPRTSGCPFDPAPGLRSLQEEGPVVKIRQWDGSTSWLVTRYDGQRALLADPRVSADITHPNYPNKGPGYKVRHEQALSFIHMDDPEHARLRRMVAASFSIKR